MHLKRKNMWKAGAGVLFLCFLFTAFRKDLAIRYYTESSDKLQKPVRLVLLTDLHSTLYGKEQEELIFAVRSQNPDVILLGGDIADDQVPHEGTELLLRAIGREYPCFYVSGNHEYWSQEAEEIKRMIAFYGVTVLESDSFLLDLAGQQIRICGVDDPDFYGQRYGLVPEGMARWENQLQRCRDTLEEGQYSVLLCHRPELTGYYTHTEETKEPGFDLVTAGHAHGGQVRIPGILNGLLAPNQGWFPKYAGGRYELGDTVMIVSRGLCRNILPRIFNRPELVVIDAVPAAEL